MQCPINESYATRQLSQLYSSFTKHLPPAAFFKILFSTFYELDPTVWAFRAVSHLYRHFDQDFHLSVLFVSSMVHHLSLISGNFRDSRLTFDASLSTHFLEKLISRTHDLVQRFPGDLSATSHDLLLDLAGALGTLVNSGSVDVLSTKIGEAFLALCLTAPVINEVQHSEIFRALKALEKLASPRLFTSLILKASLTTFDHIIGPCLSTLRSHQLINLAKALEHTVASFHAGDVPHRRPYKRKRKTPLEPGPSHDSDEWEVCEGPGLGKAKQTKAKAKARDGTLSESSVSGLEDAGQRKRVKRPRLRVTYQPSEGGTEDDSPAHSSGNEDSGKAYDQDRELEDDYKPVTRSTKERAVTRLLESRSKVLRPQQNQIIKSSQPRSATRLVIQPVLGLKTSSTTKQEAHRSCLSSDDDLNLFAYSSPR